MSKYDKAIGVPCDLSQVSMMECADYVGPSFSYELRVSPVQSAWARHLVRKIGAASEDHPFAPCINVVEYPDYAPTEWSLHSNANGRSMGSEGCR